MGGNGQLFVHSWQNASVWSLSGRIRPTELSIGISFSKKCCLTVLKCWCLLLLGHYGVFETYSHHRPQKWDQGQVTSHWGRTRSNRRYGFPASAQHLTIAIPFVVDGQHGCKAQFGVYVQRCGWNIEKLFCSFGVLLISCARYKGRYILISFRLPGCLQFLIWSLLSEESRFIGLWGRWC